jgi:hypothetical protein
MQMGGCLASFGRLSNHCCTALQAASYEGQAEVVQMLLDAGARVHVQVEGACPSSGGQGGYYGDALIAVEEGWNRYLNDISVLRGTPPRDYPKVRRLLQNRRSA